jgi:hypothetical protein
MILSAHRAVLLGVVFVFAAAAPAAQAFQFDNAQGGVSPPQNFMDLGMPSASDSPSSKFSDSKTPAATDDGFSVHFDNGSAWGSAFGGSSFNQKYNFERQFDRYNPGN